MARAKRKQHHSTHHASNKHHSTHSRKENGGNDTEYAAERMISAGREQMGHMQKNAKSALDVFSGPMARIMDHNWSLFQRTLHAMQEESLRLFNRRLEHTSQIIENSRDFQGISGLMQLQQEWLIDCARDYSEQATRFAKLFGEMAVDSTERFAEASSEALERGESEIEDAEEEYESEEQEHRATS
ncbi:MAG TPA: hypothetical protein VHT03_11300 [Rhizomicrobium sp.]|jgi:hypothetical protein|nr:hypothetical protein [Rhizomicrobium sp.]